MDVKIFHGLQVIYFNMIKVTIKTSFLYNDLISELMQLKGLIKESIPSTQEILDRLPELKKDWDRVEEGVIKSIEDATHLSFLESIPCYIVGRARPYSDPLTIPLFFKGSKNYDAYHFIHTLTHELIHVILVQNNIKILSLETATKFKTELRSLIVHIYVHAIHEYVFRSVFSEEDLIIEKEKSKALPDLYYRSWKLVDEIGYKKIIREIRSFKKLNENEKT